MSEAAPPALSSALARAIEDLVDAKVAAALAARTATPDNSPWLSLAEAAEYLRVSPRTIARMREQGRVRVSYVGRRVLVNRADLDAAQSQI